VSTRPPVKLSILRDIGWREWDPIGLAGPDGEWASSSAADEYDGYLMEVVGLVRNGEAHDEIVAYLMRIETEYMGLRPLPTTRMRAEATVVAIKGYLATIA
jgi:hypothetical protein